MGRKKALKHCYLQGIVTCPYFLGPENGVRFLGGFRFAVVSATFSSHFLSGLASEPFCCDLAQVKASGIFKPPLPLTSYITGLVMCKVCTEAVHSVAL